MAKAILRPFEISEREVTMLQERQLVDLVRLLLNAEVQAAGIPQSAVHASLRINVPDGGEDGRAEWEGGPDRTDYIPNRFSVFQMKAEALSVTEVAQEPITHPKKGKPRTKVAVSEVVVRGGAYVMVTSKTNTITPTAKGRGASGRPKLDEMRDALRTSIVAHLPKGKQKKAAGLTVDIYGPARIKAWVNRHPMVALWVRQQFGMASADFPFKTLEEWSMYEDHRFSVFIPTQNAVKDLTAIQAALAVPRQVVRLTGFSGLGKSRLAFEAARAPVAQGGASLAPILAYARRANLDVEHAVEDFVRGKVRAAIVVDDCSPEDHRRLRDLVRRADSELSLLTMDYDVGDGGAGDRSIVLSPVPDDVVKGILLQAGGLINNDDLDRATEFCSGFPEVAVLVVEALRDGAQHFADFKDRDRVAERLIWGRRAADLPAQRALSTLSIFRAVGCDPPIADQFEWVANNLLNISFNELEALIKPFERRTIVQRRGYSLSIEPRPLAASIAAWFWRDATTAQRNVLLSGKMPDQLKEAMCQRLADLNYLKGAREIAAQLCGPNGPFGNAEALNTEIGARCLREIAQVAPEEAMEALERAFEDWSVDRLKLELGPGRRDIVWALETLLWLPATFQQAIKFTLRLATGENERWGNNATSEFAQRFRIQLPATSVDLTTRLECLRAFVDSASAGDAPILVKALGLALDDRGTSWISGSQSHGTLKSLEHYQPKLWEEIFAYARGTLSLLPIIAMRFPDLLDSCRAVLSSASPGIVLQVPVVEDFESAIRALKPSDRTWGELLENLSWTISNELTAPELKDHRDRVLRLYRSLLPVTLRDRILFYVKAAPYHLIELDDDDDDDDRSFERPSRRASELGRECASNWDVFVEVLPQLSAGESREGFAFGRAFCESDGDPAAIFNAATAAVLATPADQRNVSLLGGILAAIWEKAPELGQGMVYSIADDDRLIPFVPYLSAVHLTEASVVLLAALVRSRKLAAGALNILSFGRVLDTISDSVLASLIAALIEDSAEATWVALHLLFMSIHQRPDRIVSLRNVIERALTRDGLMQVAPKDPGASHHLEQVAQSALRHPERGEVVARSLAGSLVELSKSKSFDRSGRMLEGLATLLLTMQPSVSLEVFANAIEDGDALERFHLRTILASPFSFSGKKEGAIFRLSNDEIIEASRHSNKFADFVAEVAPLFDAADGRRSWTSLGRALIDEFGARQTFLKSLSINIGTGGWSGPTSNYLSSFGPPLKEMAAHRLKEVRKWAREMLADLERQISRETKNEEETRLRRG